MRTTRKFRFFIVAVLVLLVGYYIFSCITFKYSLPIEEDVKISVYSSGQFYDLSEAQSKNFCASINHLNVRRRFPLFNFNSSYKDNSVQEIRLSSSTSPIHVSIYLFSEGQSSFIVNGPNMNGLQLIIREDGMYNKLLDQVTLFISAERSSV